MSSSTLGPAPLVSKQTCLLIHLSRSTARGRIVESIFHQDSCCTLQVEAGCKGRACPGWGSEVIILRWWKTSFAELKVEDMREDDPQAQKAHHLRLTWSLRLFLNKKTWGEFFKLKSRVQRRCEDNIHKMTSHLLTAHRHRHHLKSCQCRHLTGSELLALRCPVIGQNLWS